MTITTTIMTDQNTALLRLMAWLSPVFPVGSFSYSNGLERAVHDDLVTDVESLQAWLQSLVIYGSGWNDAVLFAESWRQAVSGGDLSEVTELAAALAGSRERYMETMLQGAAFLIAAKSWDHAVFERLPSECAYPVAVGAVAGAHGIPLTSALSAYLQAYCINLLQASIRLSVTGQSGVTALMAALETILITTAARAAHSTLDELGSATFLADITAMKHETQHSRLFRS
ncbi:urease accessory protein UreF [Brucella grignonensis]|uniref:Urease accessory protein UreF n=1 Tax=Brucella grignonensis TaxID=94627 RepID=A0A256F6K3_9HYPH|nr:urease accessory protein UreF [Brucella grignonensis]OYR10360.1 ureF family protein [Brucella grignonensis]